MEKGKGTQEGGREGRQGRGSREREGKGEQGKRREGGAGKEKGRGGCGGNCGPMEWTMERGTGDVME